MKRKWLFLLPVLLAAVLLSMIGTGDYLSVMEANWDLVFPKDAQWKLLYETDSGPSPHGDGWRYHVYAYEQEAPVAAMVIWTEEDGTTVFSESYVDACERWLDEIEVPSELRPDYESCRVCYNLHKDNSQLLIWWDPAEKTIAFAEFFI